MWEVAQQLHHCTDPMSTLKEMELYIQQRAVHDSRFLHIYSSTITISPHNNPASQQKEQHHFCGRKFSQRNFTCLKTQSCRTQVGGQDQTFVSQLSSSFWFWPPARSHSVVHKGTIVPSLAHGKDVSSHCSFINDKKHILQLIIICILFFNFC